VSHYEDAIKLFQSEFFLSELHKVSKSRFFWLYGLSLWIPSAFYKCAIFVAFMEIYGSFIGLMISPYHFDFWKALPGVATCIFVASLVMSWFLFLGSRLRPYYITTYMKTLFFIIRRGREPKDLSPEEILSLFPSPKPGSLTIGTYRRITLLTRRLAIISSVVGFTMMLSWTALGITNYPLVADFCPPGSPSAMMLFLAFMFTMMGPAMLHLFIKPYLAKRIRKEDYEEFKATVLLEEAKTGPSLTELSFDQVEEVWTSEKLGPELAKKKWFKWLGVISLWNEKDFPLLAMLSAVFLFLPLSGLLSSATSMSGLLQISMLGLIGAVIVPMSFASSSVLTDNTGRNISAVLRYIYSVPFERLKAQIPRHSIHLTFKRFKLDCERRAIEDAISKFDTEGAPLISLVKAGVLMLGMIGCLIFLAEVVPVIRSYQVVISYETVVVLIVLFLALVDFAGLLKVLTYIPSQQEIAEITTIKLLELALRSKEPMTRGISPND